MAWQNSDAFAPRERIALRFPSPLWGGEGVGGRGVSRASTTARHLTTPSLPSPTRGEGRKRARAQGGIKNGRPKPPVSWRRHWLTLLSAAPADDIERHMRETIGADRLGAGRR